MCVACVVGWMSVAIVLDRLSMIIEMSSVLIIPGGTVVEVFDVEAVAWLAAVVGVLDVPCKMNVAAA